MKALITAGGKGIRLRPITHTNNKHLIPIANKPMIHYAIEAVVEAGIKDPQRFGVPEIKEGKIIKIEEKPKNPRSSYAVTGIYFYDSHIFEAVNNIKPGWRGELKISDAHQYLIDKGYKVGHSEISGWWKDTGKPEDLLEANRLVLEQIINHPGKVG